MLELYAISLKGKSYREVFEYNLDFVYRYKHKIMSYFEGLISKLRQDYDIYFVTTNFDFTAEAFTKYFNLTGFYRQRFLLKIKLFLAK